MGGCGMGLIHQGRECIILALVAQFWISKEPEDTGLE